MIWGQPKTKKKAKQSRWIKKESKKQSDDADEDESRKRDRGEICFRCFVGEGKDKRVSFEAPSRRFHLRGQTESSKQKMEWEGEEERQIEGLKNKQDGRTQRQKN